MWTTPTLQDITTEVIRGFNASISGADAALARNNLYPVAKVFSGHLHELHGAFDYAVRQRFVLTCDDDFLDRHGAEMKPAVPRKPPSPAQGLATIQATGPASMCCRQYRPRRGSFARIRHYRQHHRRRCGRGAWRGRGYRGG